MSDLLVNAIVMSVVALVFNVFLFYAVQRREARRDLDLGSRDDKINRLELRLTEFQENDLTHLREEIDHASLRRDGIYKRIEEGLISRRECGIKHEQLGLQFGAVELRLSVISGQITELMKETSGTTRAVEMLTTRVEGIAAKGAS